MKFYVLEHHRLGVYCGHLPTPRYSWKHWADRGKRFTTREDALAYLETTPMPRVCRVREKPV